MRRLTLLAALLALPLSATTAAADSTYQTERLVLQPVAASGEWGSGMVVNAHPNGPRIYAHEQYLLTGAKRRETYQVYLLLTEYNASTYSADCAALRAAPGGTGLPTSSIRTNSAGNGSAKYVFSFDFVNGAGLRGMTFTAAWRVDLGSSPAYRTNCTVIALD